MNLLITDTLLNGKKTDIKVTGNKITMVGDSIDRRGCADYEHINGEDTAVFPFLHNGHTHSPMVLLRGYGDDMNLDQWLQTRIWPIEARLKEEDYYWGNRLAYVEMIKSGTGFFNEMYMNPACSLEALKELPLKAQINYPIIDGMDEDSGREQVKACERFFKTSEVPENVQLGIALHSVYANSLYSLEWARDFSREKDLKIHIHLCETENEISECRKAHNGMSPIEYLNSLDFLNVRVQGAHTVWLSDRDINLMADKGMVAIHNPVSNMKLATGKAFPYRQLKERSIDITLGTDGAASNNNLDLFEEMKIAALLQKHHFRDPMIMPAHEIFSIATEKSAKIFGTGDGLIGEGSAADLILVDLKSTSLIPTTDIISNLVYSAAGDVVKTLIVGGKILMKDRIVEGEEEIRENAALCADRLIEGNK